MAQRRKPEADTAPVTRPEDEAVRPKPVCDAQGLQVGTNLLRALFVPAPSKLLEPRDPLLVRPAVDVTVARVFNLIPSGRIVAG
jgi:hypothetical protein